MIAVGYVGLALVSAGLYAASTAKFVDYSQTAFVFGPGYLANATFVRTTDGWAITVRWRFENPGRLAVTIGNFQARIVVDNRSDDRVWFDPAKVATEYTFVPAFFSDRFRGPVIGPGASWDREWQFNVTAAADVARIAADPMDGKVYIGILEGTMLYFVADVDSQWLQGVPPSFHGV